MIRNIECLKPKLDALPLANPEGSGYARINVDRSRRKNIVGTDVAIGSERRLSESRRIKVVVRSSVGLKNVSHHQVDSFIRSLPGERVIEPAGYGEVRTGLQTDNR